MVRVLKTQTVQSIGYILKRAWSKPIIFTPNFRNPFISRLFAVLTSVLLTSRQPSPHGTIPSDWCQALCPFAETYPIKTETCPQLLKPHIHGFKPMQSVANLTSISRSWPSKSMGTNRYKPFTTYIMQGNFTLLLPATVSTVETVKNAQLLHNPSALTSDWPYTRRELSCRISPSRPGIRSSFYLYHICSSFH